MSYLIWPASLLLLLSPHFVDCDISQISTQGKSDIEIEHGLDSETYPHPTHMTREPKEDPGNLVKILDVNDDVDFVLPYTYASMTKPEMPDDFTICGAFRAGAWTIKFASANFYQINDLNGVPWSFVKATSVQGSTDFSIWFGKFGFERKNKVTWFPLTWQRFCVSLDTVAQNVSFVVNGEVLLEEHLEELQENVPKPPGLDIMLGISIRPNYGNNMEFPGEFTNYNIFSSPQSAERMVAMTTAGGEECGALGDYVNWKVDQWVLNHKTKIKMVSRLEGPCQPESSIHVYTGNFQVHTHCMQFCPKIGKGRSPPVRTLKEYKTLQTNLHAITPDIRAFMWMWLAATDWEEEGVWRDAYTQEVLENYTKPWAPGHDYHLTRELYPTANCLLWYTGYPDEIAMEEWFCGSYDMTCPCEYKNEPILVMRGICPKSTLLPLGRSFYTPQQLAGSPKDIFYVGLISTQIRYNSSREICTLISPTREQDVRYRIFL